MKQRMERRDMNPKRHSPIRIVVKRVSRIMS